MDKRGRMSYKGIKRGDRMHENSLKAYREGNVSGELDSRAAIVLGAIRQLGICTAREIAEKLGFRDMNAVRPRVTELLKAGRIEQYGNKLEKAHSNAVAKTVMTVRVKMSSGVAGGYGRKQTETDGNGERTAPVTQPEFFPQEQLDQHWGF